MGYPIYPIGMPYISHWDALYIPWGCTINPDDFFQERFILHAAQTFRAIAMPFLLKIENNDGIIIHVIVNFQITNGRI